MKLPLKYFLLTCFLLGSVAIPVGWRSYQKSKRKYQDWKFFEVKRLERELINLRSDLRSLAREAYTDEAVWREFYPPPNEAMFDYSSQGLRLAPVPGLSASRPEVVGRIRVVEAQFDVVKKELEALSVRTRIERPEFR